MNFPTEITEITKQKSYRNFNHIYCFGNGVCESDDLDRELVKLIKESIPQSNKDFYKIFNTIIIYNKLKFEYSPEENDDYEYSIDDSDFYNNENADQIFYNRYYIQYDDSDDE